MLVSQEQFEIIFPKREEMEKVEVESGIYEGKWLVDRKPLRIRMGTEYRVLLPNLYGNSILRAHHLIQDYKWVEWHGYEIVPVPVLISAVQNRRYHKEFYRGLIGTSQITGSAVVGRRLSFPPYTEESTKVEYLLGHPKVSVEDDFLSFEGLRDDRPIAFIEPQNGEVKKLDKITFWGTSKKAADAYPVKQKTYMSNVRRGNMTESVDPRFVTFEMTDSRVLLVKAEKGIHPMKFGDYWTKEDDYTSDNMTIRLASRLD